MNFMLKMIVEIRFIQDESPDRSSLFVQPKLTQFRIQIPSSETINLMYSLEQLQYNTIQYSFIDDS